MFLEHTSTQESQHVNIDDEGDDQQQEQFTKKEKMLKSNIFKAHSKKIYLENGFIQVTCNYCGQQFKYKHGGGYGTFKKHLNSKYPTQVGIDKTQSQITSLQLLIPLLFLFILTKKIGKN